MQIRSPDEWRTLYLDALRALHQAHELHNEHVRRIVTDRAGASSSYEVVPDSQVSLGRSSQGRRSQGSGSQGSPGPSSYVPRPTPRPPRRFQGAFSSYVAQVPDDSHGSEWDGPFRHDFTQMLHSGFPPSAYNMSLEVLPGFTPLPGSFSAEGGVLTAPAGRFDDRLPGYGTPPPTLPRSPT